MWRRTGQPHPSAMNTPISPFPEARTEVPSEPPPAFRPQRRRRRTQQERSAETRALLLDVTVECLAELGYQGATAQVIAQRAGLSRGAQLHRFGSKMSLMIQAMEHLFERRLSDFRRGFEALPRGADHTARALGLLWETVAGPVGYAYLERAIAARTDPELRHAMLALTRRMDAQVAAATEELFTPAPGLRGADDFVLCWTALFALLEGLAIEKIVRPDDVTIDRVVARCCSGSRRCGWCCDSRDRAGALIYAGPMWWRSMAIGCLVWMGCSGDKPAASPDDATSDDAPSGEAQAPGDGAADAKAGDASAPAAAAGGIPERCETQDGEFCLPPKKWVQKLCQGDFPTVALAMFRAGTPWKRGYVAQPTKAWNASGGGSSPEMMKVDEEVLVLRRFSGQSPGGIQVSGAQGGVDALRWDGMCVTLDAAEIRYDPPPSPRNARIIWNRIEYDIREKLKEEEQIRQTYIAFKKACKGVTVGEVSKECETLDGELSQTIADWVRAHDTFPTPEKLP